MKKVIATITAFSLLSANLVSCKKDSTFSPATSNTKTVNTTEKVLELSKRYQSKSTGHGNVALRSWKQYAAADAIGALDGAGTGGAVAGLWGAVCGGITYGVFTSCALDMFDRVAPNPDNPTLDGSNPTIPGTTLSANDPGNRHNAMLAYVLGNPNMFGGAGTPKLDDLKTYCISNVSSTYGFDNSSLTNIVGNCKPYDSIVRYTENPSAYFASLGENDFRTVSETFYNTAFGITDNASLKQYYNDFVTIINGSSDFTDTQKAALITYSSIATASILYHNN